MSIGSVLIGFEYCKVYDAIDIWNCIKCCGFHLRAKCKWTSGILACPRCTDPHSLSECTIMHLKCFHCSYHNVRDNGDELKTNYAV